MGARVGIEQQLVRVEAMADIRLVGAMDAVAINLTGANIGQVAVKDLVGVFGQDYAVQLSPAGGVKKTNLYLRSIRGEQSKIGALAVPGRATRVRSPFAKAILHDAGQWIFSAVSLRLRSSVERDMWVPCRR